MKKFISLLASILICQSAGLIGSIFTVKAIPGWYENLIKPAFNPPNWLFSPVWITLYTMMGIALYLVWQKRGDNNSVNFALLVFAVHLIFNALWSVIFFGMRNPGLAFIEIMILWLMIIITISLFYKINKIAAYLLMPYLCWVSFAALLNFYIWCLN